MLSLSVVNGCGDVSSQQTVYFESPNYPQAVREMMICVLIINVRKGVQQLRLDFQMFEVNTLTTNMNMVLAMFKESLLIKGFQLFSLVVQQMETAWMISSSYRDIMPIFRYQFSVASTQVNIVSTGA